MCRSGRMVLILQSTHRFNMTLPHEDRRVEEPLREEDVCSSDCKGVFILERRVNIHAAELLAIKSMLTENNLKTAEVLEIIGLGRSFFKVLGWIGDMLKPIIIISGVISATIVWFKTGSIK